MTSAFGCSDRRCGMPEPPNDLRPITLIESPGVQRVKSHGNLKKKGSWCLPIHVAFSRHEGFLFYVSLGCYDHQHDPARPKQQSLATWRLLLQPPRPPTLGSEAARDRHDSQLWSSCRLGHHWVDRAAGQPASYAWHKRSNVGPPFSSSYEKQRSERRRYEANGWADHGTPPGCLPLRDGVVPCRRLGSKSAPAPVGNRRCDRSGCSS